MALRRPLASALASACTVLAWSSDVFSASRTALSATWPSLPESSESPSAIALSRYALTVLALSLATFFEVALTLWSAASALLATRVACYAKALSELQESFALHEGTAGTAGLAALSTAATTLASDTSPMARAVAAPQPGPPCRGLHAPSCGGRLRPAVGQGLHLDV